MCLELNPQTAFFSYLKAIEFKVVCSGLYSFGAFKRSQKIYKFSLVA